MLGVLAGAVGLLVLLASCGPDNADFLPFAYSPADAAVDAGEPATTDAPSSGDVSDAGLASDATADAGLRADGSSP